MNLDYGEKRPDEHRVQRLRRQQRDHCDFHRRADVLPRVETGREHLHEDESDEAYAVGDDRVARRERVLGGERAVLEERRHERHRSVGGCSWDGGCW